MRFSPRTPLMSAGVLLTLSCDSTPESLSSVTAVTVESAALSGMRANASGHPVVQGTPVQNVLDQRYSFSAVSADPFPTAMGQVDVHYVRFTGEELTVHADVTCLSVVGVRLGLERG